jgi:hypothetical protein
MTSPLREWIDAVRLLNESVNVEAMAKAIDAAWQEETKRADKPDTPWGEKKVREFREAMDEAKRVLKRVDRVAWFARWLRIGMVYRTPSFYPFLQEYADRSGMKPGTDFTHEDGRYMHDGWRQFLRQMEHWLGTPYQPFKDYQWNWQTPHGVDTDFYQMENRFKETQKVFIPYEPEDEIITFPDGYRWVDLKRPSCDVEGEAMGHCGNSAAYSDDDTVLSLRQVITKEGEKFWRPALTFILNTRSGMLGEMKGRENSKPKKTYHPYIVALLRQPFVKGILGGGYKPEANFDLGDLDKATQEELIREKPGLLSPTAYIKRFGVTDELKERLRSILVEMSGENRMRWQNDYLITIEADHWGDVMDWFGSRTTKDFVEKWANDDLIHSRGTAAPYFQLLRALPPDLFEVTKRLIIEESKPAKMPNTALELAQIVGPGMGDELMDADNVGRSVAAKRKGLAAIQKALARFDDGFRIWTFDTMNGEFGYDAPMLGTVPIFRLIGMMAEGDAENTYNTQHHTNVLHIETPKEGWDDGFDAPSAIAKLRDNLKNDLQ